MAHFGRNQWLNLNKNYWITLIGINGSILQEFASDEQSALYDAFVGYHRDDSHGYDSWEEYRDAKVFDKREEITIESAQKVDTNDKPRETPSVDQDEILGIKK